VQRRSNASSGFVSQLLLLTFCLMPQSGQPACSPGVGVVAAVTSADGSGVDAIGGAAAGVGLDAIEVDGASAGSDGRRMCCRRGCSRLSLVFADQLDRLCRLGLLVLVLLVRRDHCLLMILRLPTLRPFATALRYAYSHRSTGAVAWRA
jgi:hypothetical protein